MSLLSNLLSLEPVLSWNRIRRNTTAFESKIIADLNSEGVSVTSIQELAGSTALSSDGAVASGVELMRGNSVRTTPELWAEGLSSTDLRAEALLTRVPQIYLLGLKDSILRLAEAYFCRPVAYHGAVLRHSMVDGASRGTRLWHQDAEDTHVLRMVVYLNDVTAEGGPFEYVPRSCRVSYRDFSGFENEVTDLRMASVVPRVQWKQITGPTGTVVLCDTARTFHHESQQKSRERAVIMIGYSSQRPTGKALAMRHFPVERVPEQLATIVSPAHADIVFGWRR